MTPIEEAIQLREQAVEAKRESQRLRRHSQSKMADLEQFCRAHNISLTQVEAARGARTS